MLRLLLPLMLSTSMSIRSPNITEMDYPFDYEIAFMMQKADTAYVKVEFERQNGIDYFDKETWLVKKIGKFSIKERYLEKQSRDIRFNQIDCRYNQGSWSIGYGLKHIESDLKPTHNLVVGWKSKAFNYDIIIAQLSAKSVVDVVSNFSRIDVSTHNEAKFRLNVWENISLSLLFNYERLGAEYDYQFKTAINLELK